MVGIILGMILGITEDTAGDGPTTEDITDTIIRGVMEDITDGVTGLIMEVADIIPTMVEADTVPKEGEAPTIRMAKPEILQAEADTLLREPDQGSIQRLTVPMVAEDQAPTTTAEPETTNPTTEGDPMFTEDLQAGLQRMPFNQIHGPG